MLACSDCYLAIHEQFTRDDPVITVWMLHGTRLGSFRGRVPSGLSACLPGSSMLHIQEGKIIKEWRCFDKRGLARQLDQLD